jgi:hypothetical protein
MSLNQATIYHEEGLFLAKAVMGETTLRTGEIKVLVIVMLVPLALTKIKIKIDAS